MTRVLFYTETGGYSGAESILVSIATSLHRNYGVDVGALVPANVPRFAADLQGGGVRVWPAKLRAKQEYRIPFIQPWLDRTNGAIALSVAQEYAPDAIILNMPDPEECLGVAFRLRKLGVPLLGWLHLPQRLEARSVKLGRFRSELCRVALRALDRFIVPGDGLPEQLARNYGIPRGRIIALPNGIVDNGPVRKVTPADDVGQLTICVVGRIHFASKGQDILASALQQMGSRAKRFRIIVAGSGPDEQALKTLAASTSATWRFLGWVSDVRSVFSAADVLAMPSRCEGLALTAVEACAAGLPMLLTPVGANEATFPAEWLLPLDASRWATALDRLDRANMPDVAGWWEANRRRFSLDSMSAQMRAIIEDAAH